MNICRRERTAIRWRKLSVSQTLENEVDLWHAVFSWIEAIHTSTTQINSSHCDHAGSEACGFRSHLQRSPQRQPSLRAPVTSSERVRQREPEPFDDGVGRCDKPQKKPRSFLGPVSAPRGAAMKDHDRRYP